MKKFLILAFASMFIFFQYSNMSAQKAQFTSNTSADDNNFKNSINMCPGGVFFGVYSMNYERLLSPHHGLVGRIDYEAVPNSYTDANIESSGFGLIVNYRWHVSEKLKSVFIGAYARYKHYSGTGKLEATDFNFDLTDLTFGLNAGKRWVWNNGLNLTFALGYGISTNKREADPSNNTIELILDEYEKEYDFLSPFLGELSIGYAF